MVWASGASRSWSSILVFMAMRQSRASVCKCNRSSWQQIRKNRYVGWPSGAAEMDFLDGPSHHDKRGFKQVRFVRPRMRQRESARHSGGTQFLARLEAGQQGFGIVEVPGLFRERHQIAQDGRLGLGRHGRGDGSRLKHFRQDGFLRQDFPGETCGFLSDNRPAAGWLNRGCVGRPTRQCRACGRQSGHRAFQTEFRCPSPAARRPGA